MSGIVGIINLDGAPVDRDLLWRMTDFMSHRGPDDRKIWIEGNVGFGHAMLRTTWEAETERQPLTLDGRVWLTADARIDGRSDLVHDLESKGCPKSVKAANDAELILYAYHTWGEECIKHLIGDFAFAIWDGPERRLFSARDHFGVRPLYYVNNGDRFVFASSANCLRIHDAVSDELDDLTIADFLLFDLNLEPSRSAFSDIRRLAPAHRLTLPLQTQSLTLNSYWALPIKEEIRYKKRRHYVEHLNDLLLNAVEDRLRTNRVGMLLSGGMDSGSVAAAARNVIKKKDQPCDLSAFTYVYDYLMPDHERYYSGLVSRKLGISINYTVSDDYKMYQWPTRRGFCPSEIINEPHRALFNDFVDSVAQYSRIALTGDGGDALFYPTENYAEKAITSLRWGELLQGMVYCLFSYGRIPRIGFRSAIKRLMGRSRSAAPRLYPKWLNESFETRFALRDRWAEQNNSKRPLHPRRNDTYESLNHPMWPHGFADNDPDVTCSSVEFRYPFFDTRVVNFLLNIPSFPWCFEKGLLRIATRRQLPEQVRKRRKTPIVQDPILVRVEQPGWQLSDYFRPVDRLFDYVDTRNISKAMWLREREEIWMHVRPLSLNYWLKSLSN